MYTIKATSWQTKGDNSTSTLTVTDGEGNVATVKMEGNKDVLQAALTKLEELSMENVY